MSVTTVARWAASAAWLLLAACSQAPSAAELQDRIDELENENTQQHAQLESAQTKAQEASELADQSKEAATAAVAQLARFDSENWRDVLPDAQGAVGDAADAAEKAADAAEETKQAADDD